MVMGAMVEFVALVFQQSAVTSRELRAEGNGLHSSSCLIQPCSSLIKPPVIAVL